MGPTSGESPDIKSWFRADPARSRPARANLRRSTANIDKLDNGSGKSIEDLCRPSGLVQSLLPAPSTKRTAD